MDTGKVGALIKRLRTEKGMTQKQLAETMNISDKTISKWERGLGCPDVSLLRELSTVLKINVEKILSGSLEPNDADGGNMKKLKFYLCPACGSALTSTGESEVSCCGRKLAPFTPAPADAAHSFTVEEVEEDYYVTFRHEMTKAHYISFLAYVCTDRVLLVKLYPEQGGEVRFPKMRGGRVYLCCGVHGLFYQ